MLHSILLTGLLVAPAPVLRVPAERPGDKILKQIDAVQRPPYDSKKSSDAKWMSAYMDKIKAYGQKRNALILRLFQADPTHPKALDLMAERWGQFEMGNIGSGDAYQKRVLADVDAVLARTKLRTIHDLGDSVKVRIKARQAAMRGENPLPLIDAYLGEFPKSRWGEEVLSETAFYLPSEKRRPLYERFLAVYPSSTYAPLIRGSLRQEDSVGKPFALSFSDAVSGKKIDLGGMRGKVVVIDFWATWCGPCVAKMPELKKVAEELGAEGLEVIGVSLDQPEKEGGLKALKAFVAKNQVPWPQYYQGKGWESEFSASWGIMSIPTVFLIDKQGNLRSTQVRDLRAEVKRLLAE